MTARWPEKSPKLRARNSRALCERTFAVIQPGFACNLRWLQSLPAFEIIPSRLSHSRKLLEWTIAAQFPTTNSSIDALCHEKVAIFQVTEVR